MINIESNTYISSLLSQRNIWSTEKIIEVFQKLLLPFESLDESSIQPSNDLAFIKTVVNDLSYKINCYKGIVDNLCENKGILCDELSINVFNADFGLDAVAFLSNYINEDTDKLNNIKSIRLFYENEERLSKALLLIKSIFPKLLVYGYKLAIKEIQNECKCDSTLTINIFPHTYNLGNQQYENIFKLFIKSHFIYSHTIFFEYVDSDDQEMVTSFDCDHYWLDLTRCGFCTNELRKYKFTPKTKIGGRKCNSKYCIYSTLSFEDISLKNKYKIVLPNLCPGIPIKKLFNENQASLFFDQPFKKNQLCKNINNTVIVTKSIDYNNIYSILNNIPTIHYTLKSAIEEFPQYDISRGLDNKEDWAEQVYKFYLNEALRGNTQCYNNLAVLHVLSNSLKDEFYDINSDCSKKITEYFTLAANGGDTSAMINLACHFMARKNYTKAIQYYLMASDHGEAAGSYSIGVIYQLGLYGYNRNTNTAIKYYKKCFDQYFSDSQTNCKISSIINNCCLNLIILMYELNYPFKNIVKTYQKVDKPSKELEYAFTVISNNMTNKAHNFFKVMCFNEIKKNESSYIKFNRIIALYNGIKNGNNVIMSDKKEALKQLKELAQSQCPDWPEWEKYIWPKLGMWSYEAKEDSSACIDYWKKSIKANPENECAYFTNIATVLSGDEAYDIWKRFAVGQGCKSCHECTNYDHTKQRCPKAEYKIATKYEDNKEKTMEMLLDAAKQEYIPALERLHIYNIQQKYLLEEKDNELFFQIGMVPNSFNPILDKFCEDSIYSSLSLAANLGSKKSVALLKVVSKLRDDKYESIFWNALSRNINDNIKTLEDIVGKKIKEGYFYPNTIAEIDYIKYANKKAEQFLGESDEAFEFLKSLAEYYVQGKYFKKALLLYKIAKEKGFDVSERINELNLIIERNEREFNYYNYGFYDEPYTWEDSMIDALDGLSDAYWNID